MVLNLVYSRLSTFAQSSDVLAKTIVYCNVTSSLPIEKIDNNHPMRRWEMFILTIWLASCGIDSIFSAISDKVLEKALRKSYLVQKIRKMSLFRHGCSGISLKALLENPELQNPPSLNAGMYAVEYISRGKKVVYIVELLVTSNWPLRYAKKKKKMFLHK